MKKIVIRILWPQAQHAVAQWQCEYCSISQSGDVESIQSLDLLAAFQQAVNIQIETPVDISVLLPGEMAILNCVQLPARNQRQALQALPFVVEESLADDVEKAHLAVGFRRQDGQWPVIVVDLAMMAAIMDQAEQVALRLSAMYVDAQLLPLNDCDVSILILNDRVLFHSRQSVAVLDCTTAASLIHLLLGEEVVQRVAICFQSDREEQTLLAQQLNTEFSALGDTTVSMQPIDDAMTLAALLLPPPAAAINLLQGRFTVRQPSGKTSWWQLAVAALLVVWLGQVALQIGSGIYFNYHAKKQEQAAEMQYRKLFPDAKQVSNPRKRLQARLLDGANNSSEYSFAKLFSASVQALNAMPNRDGLAIEQLRYEIEEGQLELELKARSIDQLDQFKQALGKLGLSSKISSANDSEGGISGRMQIGKGV